MILRDVDNIKVGSTSVNKVYQGNYKVYDKNKIALEGYCKQNTTTGKNLLNTLSQPITRYYGGSYTAYTISTSDLNLNLASGSYTLSLDIKSANGGRINKINLIDNNNTIYTWTLYKLIPTSYQYNSHTFTFASDVVIKRVDVQNAEGTETFTFNNIMLEKSSSATEFEPYTGGIASPNPNYPQEIEVMEGKQVRTIKSKNEFDYSDFSNYIQTLVATGTNRQFNISGYGTYQYLISLEGQHTISGSWNSDNFNGDVKVIYEDDTNENIFSSYTGASASGNINFHSNSSKNIKAIQFRMFTNCSVNINDFQIEQGSTATPYVPYKSQDFEVDLESKNLYEGSQDFSGTWNNDRFWGSDTNTYNGLVVKKRTGQWNGLNKDINVESGKTYTFSCYIKSDSARPIGIYSSGGTSGISLYKQLNTTDSWERYSFTITASASGTVRFRIENTTSVADNYTYICGYQLEEGSATDYEPYYNYKLAGIGDYKDNIYTKKGKWYVKSLIGKSVLDGSENWNKGGNTYLFYMTKPSDMVAQSQLYCNYFKNQETASQNGIWIGNTQMYINDLNYTALAAFKTWLSTHNTEVYYALATPTEEEITSPTLIQQLNRLYQAM